MDGCKKQGKQDTNEGKERSRVEEDGDGEEEEEKEKEEKGEGDVIWLDYYDFDHDD